MPTARWHRPRSSWPRSGSRSTRGRFPRARRCRRSAWAPPSWACTPTRSARSMPHSRRRATRRRATARAPSHTSATPPEQPPCGASRTAHSRVRAARARMRTWWRWRSWPARARERAAEPRRTPATPAARAFPPVLPPDVMRGSYVGLVTGDAALVARAREEAARRGVRLRVAGPDDGQTLGDLVWGCELVIVGRDARDDETAQRVLRSARDLLEMA